MKKIITLCIVLFITFTSAYGQDKEYRYHPWSEFQGDTVAFLTANFSNQTHFFNGKSILDVVDVLEKEMPVKKITYLTYPETSTLQVIDLIFDKRKKWEPFNQLHFYVGNFDTEYTEHEIESILELKPEQITPLTRELRHRLSRIIVYNQNLESNFSVIKLVNWSISD